MSSDVLDRNKKFLEKMTRGDVPESEIPTGVGSFLMILFREELWDCIPLFFDFLNYYTGEDYSNELEWVQECLDAGKKEYEEFKKRVEEDPLVMLALALSD